MEDLVLSGETTLIRNYFRRTVAKYSKAIKLKSDQANGYYCRGMAKYQLGEFQGAHEDFTKVIDVRSDFADAYVNRAWACFMLGRRAEAMADLAKAKELDYPIPENASVFFAHGGETQ